MHRFANPTRFMKVANAIFPFVSLACLGLLGAGLYYGLYDSPTDYQQGHTVRIMYIHVPAAYMAVMVYGIMATASASSLIWKHPLADLIARASAPLNLLHSDDPLHPWRERILDLYDGLAREAIAFDV